ncbi:Uncharacterized protein DBV15_08987, partial [Temnothorax longispinosus]
MRNAKAKNSDASLREVKSPVKRGRCAADAHQDRCTRPKHASVTQVAAHLRQRQRTVRPADYDGNTITGAPSRAIFALGGSAIELTLPRSLHGSQSPTPVARNNRSSCKESFEGFSAQPSNEPSSSGVSGPSYESACHHGYRTSLVPDGTTVIASPLSQKAKAAAYTTQARTPYALRNIIGHKKSDT